MFCFTFPAKQTDSMDDKCRFPFIHLIWYKISDEEKRTETIRQALDANEMFWKEKSNALRAL